MSPTFEASASVRRGYRKLPRRQQEAFDRAVRLLVAGVRDTPPSYHASLRIKRHQASGKGVWLAIGEHKLVD